ncbi:MAG: RNA-binding cell elongation regulator Jag/EloR [bacterium]|nr:RNA-binding cell elongation regulator Jag/EloR [bacterium]
MDNIIEQQGKTVDKAIEEGLKKLGVSKEKVKVEVIDEGKKGLFGLFGVSPAMVRLTLIHDATGVATQMLNEVLRLMNIKSGVTSQEKDGKLIFDIVSGDAPFLIGKNGQTLDALQYLINIMMKKNCRSKKDIVLDIAQYRTKKDDNIVQLAVDAASRVIKTGRDVVLDPMGSHDRQIIHMTLQNHRKVNTKSIGDGEERKVVIFPKPGGNGNGRGREKNNYSPRKENR